ncbi:hypothetical protein AAFF_G00347240, partial [Aldrovandia affinis]
SPQSQTKRRASSSASPPPKKNKKKKHSRRFDSSSPPRKERKRRSGRKHKRCRSASGSRRKRRYRSGSPKNTNKAKNKERKRPPVGRLHRRGSCCSSHSRSADRPSPLYCRHGADGHRPSYSGSGSDSGPSSPSPTSPTRTVDPTTVWQNGHRDGTRNSRDCSPDQSQGHKSQDESEPIRAFPSPWGSPSLRPRDTEVATGLPVPPGEATSEDGRHGAFPGKGVARRKSHSSSARSSDSLPSHRGHSQRSKDTRPKKAKGRRSSRRRHRRRARARHHSSSASPSRHGRPAGDGGRKFPSQGVRHHASSWSSGRSASRTRSRSREHGGHTESPHAWPNNAREKDSDGRAPHDDTEKRAHHRSRSYSPIRKRRSDSPSFMEARRITSARKRPIPYYRPSPSSPSSLSSCSSVRGYSRRGDRSPSRNFSYYSRGSSSESPAF